MFRTSCPPAPVDVNWWSDFITHEPPCSPPPPTSYFDFPYQPWFQQAVKDGLECDDLWLQGTHHHIGGRVKSTLTFFSLCCYYLRGFKFYLNRNWSLRQSCWFGRDSVISWLNFSRRNKNTDVQGMNSETDVISVLIHEHGVHDFWRLACLLTCLSVLM